MWFIEQWKINIDNRMAIRFEYMHINEMYIKAVVAKTVLQNCAAILKYLKFFSYGYELKT